MIGGVSMLYVVSMLTAKQAYIDAVNNKKSLEYLLMHSLFLCYDTVKKTVSAPMSLSLLYTKFKQEPDMCAFQIERQMRTQNKQTAPFYLLSLHNSNFNYIPVFCNNTLERLNKYRYFVLARICNVNKATVALRLYDSVMRKEFVMPIEKVYAHHKSDLGSNVDVIGNLRVFSNVVGNETQYTVKSVCGNMVVELLSDGNTGTKQEYATNKVIVNDCFVTCKVNNNVILTDIVYDTDYDWENHGTILELPAVTDVNIYAYYTAQFQGALHSIETLIIPESVVHINGAFLSAIQNLKDIKCYSKYFKYVDGIFYDIDKKTVLWVAPTAQNDLSISNSVIASEALRKYKGKTIRLTNCTVERCAFTDSSIELIYIGANVHLKPGALRGLHNLCRVVLCSNLTIAEVEILCNFNTWFGLGDFSITDKRFVGKNPYQVQFEASDAQYIETVATINKALLQYKNK